MITSFFRISGMHCISCAQTIEDIVSKQNNIKNVKVYFPLNLLIVEHEEPSESTAMERDDIAKQLNKQLKANGYSIKRINLDEMLTQPKKLVSNILSRIVFIFLLLVVLHIPRFVSNFPMIGQGHTPFAVFIFLILLVLSFKYILYMTNEIKGHKLGMGTFLSIALILTASNFIISLSTGKGYLWLKNILSSYAMILFFVELGKNISEFIRLKFFKEYLRSFEILKKPVTTRNNGIYIEKMIKDVKENDIVIVKPGNTIYFDGIVVKGNSHVNESIVTGESEPIFKKEKDRVISGSENLDGTLEILVRNSFFKSQLGIIHFYMLQNLSEKTHAQQIMSKFLKFFIIGELLLIIIAIFYHINSGILYAFERAVTIALLSCPCAFGIAAPLVLGSAYLLSFKNNILLKNPDILEIFKNAKSLILDKTGILTNAKQHVINYEFFNSNKYLVDILYSMTKQSNHPKSVTLNNFITKTYNNLNYIEDIHTEEIAGKGLRCIYNNKSYFIGNFSLLVENFKKLESLKKNEIDRSLYYFTPDEIIAIFDLQEEINLKTKEVLSLLKTKYKQIAILSGDKFDKVKECAGGVGITTFYAEKMPAEKLDIVREYKKEGITIYVGDGLNDAFVLKESDIGISYAGATDLAKNSADVILLDNDLSGLIKLDRLSNVATLAIKVNITWAVLYNIIFIPLGFGVFHSIHISPVIASILMSGSSILLTLNSFLFLKFAR